ncbi:MAG: N-acetyl-gamma-glutamyl-phosphate reductase [Methylophilaceae bacterium]
MSEKIKVSIIGGTGYTGIELLRLLALHPNVSIDQITSRGDAGKKVKEVYPSLRGILEHCFVDSEKADLSASDLVFFATPNGIAMNYAKKLLAEGIKIIDLAADFRIQDLKVWQRWYGMTHSCPDVLKKAVYGLPEFNREKIKQAELVANPGCYSTAVQLGLIPLLKKGLIDPMTIIADVKSGISGAGKKNETQLLMSEVDGDFRAYGLTGHRHLPEIEENLSVLSSTDQVKLIFVPHLVPMVRGIHATMYVDCLDIFDPLKVFDEFYKNELFIDVMEKDACPQTKSVTGSNICRISVHKVPNSNKLVILSVIDNLIKGASGQAVQNMNIMMRWPEKLGLNLIPLTP